MERDPLFEMAMNGLPRPPSLLSGRHYSLDADARCEELAEAGFVSIARILLSRAIAMTPGSLRALFATFSSVRQLPSAEREERLDAIEAAARRDLVASFTRTLWTSLYTVKAPI